MTERLLTPIQDHGVAGLRALPDLEAPGRGRHARRSRRAGSGRSPSCWRTRASSTRRDCLAEYQRQGKSILEIPDPRTAARRSRPGSSGSATPSTTGYDVIYQMPFVHRRRPGHRRLPGPGRGSRHRRGRPTSRSTPSWPASRPSPATCCSSASTPTPSRRSPARAHATCTCGWDPGGSRRWWSTSSGPTGTGCGANSPRCSTPRRPTAVDRPGAVRPLRLLRVLRPAARAVARRGLADLRRRHPRPGADVLGRRRGRDPGRAGGAASTPVDGLRRTAGPAGRPGDAAGRGSAAAPRTRTRRSG